MYQYKQSQKEINGQQKAKIKIFKFISYCFQRTNNLLIVTATGINFSAHRKSQAHNKGKYWEHHACRLGKKRHLQKTREGILIK